MAEAKSKSDSEKKHELISHWAELFLTNLNDKLDKHLNKTTE